VRRRRSRCQRLRLLHSEENKLRPICEHIDHRGRDKKHCVSEPDDLDVFRTAIFLAKLHDSPQVRVIGADGKAGPLIEDAFERLCDEGFLDPGSGICNGNNKLAYETVDRGRGWFRHHHHHFHLSTYGGKSAPAPTREAAMECLVPGCGRGEGPWGGSAHLQTAMEDTICCSKL